MRFSSAESRSMDIHGQQCIGLSLGVGRSVVCTEPWVSIKEVLGYILVIVWAF